MCLERNMISPTDLDSSESSPLIEKSTKDSVSCWNNVQAVGSANTDNVVNPTSPTLVASRFQNAIPYVKNDFRLVVEACEIISLILVCPKVKRVNN